jgi:hypothetical protein
MCARVRLEDDYSELKIPLKFDADAPARNFERDWNIPPTRPMLGVTATAIERVGAG